MKSVSNGINLPEWWIKETKKTAAEWGAAFNERIQQPMTFSMARTNDFQRNVLMDGITLLASPEKQTPAFISMLQTSADALGIPWNDVEAEIERRHSLLLPSE